MSTMAERSTNQVLEYNMEGLKRGQALIFSQEQFKSNKPRERSGADRDRADLAERFQMLGFDVDTNVNLNKENMMKKLREAANADHRDANCFVCIVLSHGDEGYIHAYDDTVNIKDIITLFRGDCCRSLVGKPKIFIFQACRGEDSDDPVTPMAGDEDEEEKEKSPVIYTIPAEADFLICYCVTEGYLAFRNPDSGSWYIQDLCETLKKQGFTLEFTELLTLVNMKVSTHSARYKRKQVKQQPCFTSMLRKKLYFRPKK